MSAYVAANWVFTPTSIDDTVTVIEKDGLVDSYNNGSTLRKTSKLLVAGIKIVNDTQNLPVQLTTIFGRPIDDITITINGTTITILPFNSLDPVKPNTIGDLVNRINENIKSYGVYCILEPIPEHINSNISGIMFYSRTYVTLVVESTILDGPKIYNDNQFTVTGINFYVPTPGVVVTSLPNSLLGPASLTLSTEWAGDNDWWDLALPWSVTYIGTSYDVINIGTNSYITFADGSDQFNNFDVHSPHLPKIMISAADHYAERIYYGIEGTSPDRTYRVRFEGTNPPPGPIAEVTYIPSSILGAALLDQYEPIGDNDWWSFGFSWWVSYLGNLYNQFFVGTNGYITFGDGATQWSGFSAVSPFMPKIMISAADLYAQRFYWGEEGNYPDRTFRFRFEGASRPPGPYAIATSIPTSLLGPASLTESTTNAGDDDWWTLTLPWSISYFGTSYDIINIGTNSYITFLDGTDQWSQFSASSPSLPKIMISADDHSAERIYYGIEGTSPDRTYRVRFEGADHRVGTNADVTSIPNSILGPAALTASTTYAGDDNYWDLVLPWSVSYLGLLYDVVYIGTNSYITFDFGSTTWSPTASYPASRKILISAYDNSAQRIYYGIEGISPNRTYRIRFEGSANTSGILGSPTLEWEAIFYENDIARIDIQMGLNARDPRDGLSGVYGSYDQYTGLTTTSYTGMSIVTLDDPAPVMNMVWEATFYENDTSRIDVQIGQNASTGGFSGVYTADTKYADISTASNTGTSIVTAFDPVAVVDTTWEATFYENDIARIDIQIENNAVVGGFSGVFSEDTKYADLITTPNTGMSIVTSIGPVVPVDMVWEAVFHENNTSRIDLQIGDNANVGGFSGVYTADAWYADLNTAPHTGMTIQSTFEFPPPPTQKEMWESVSDMQSSATVDRKGSGHLNDRTVPSYILGGKGTAKQRYCVDQVPWPVSYSNKTNDDTEIVPIKWLLGYENLSGTSSEPIGGINKILCTMIKSTPGKSQINLNDPNFVPSFVINDNTWTWSQPIHGYVYLAELSSPVDVIVDDDFQVYYRLAWEQPSCDVMGRWTGPIFTFSYNGGQEFNIVANPLITKDLIDSKLPIFKGQYLICYIPVKGAKDYITIDFSNSNLPFDPELGVDNPTGLVNGPIYTFDAQRWDDIEGSAEILNMRGYGSNPNYNVTSPVITGGPGATSACLYNIVTAPMSGGGANQRVLFEVVGPGTLTFSCTVTNTSHYSDSILASYSTENSDTFYTLLDINGYEDVGTHYVNHHFSEADGMVTIVLDITPYQYQSWSILEVTWSEIQFIPDNPTMTSFYFVDVQGGDQYDITTIRGFIEAFNGIGPMWSENTFGETLTAGWSFDGKVVFQSDKKTSNGFYLYGGSSLGDALSSNGITIDGQSSGNTTLFNTWGQGQDSRPIITNFVISVPITPADMIPQVDPVNFYKQD